jgi:glycogen debranching enzyme
MTDRIDTARATLRQNDRGGYSVPTARLYPFQWNWDSAFVAMGWATFDGPRAWQEVLFLLKGQWDDGMIPQIIFHAPSDDYFPGPEVWRTGKSPETSGITQPPVLATAVRHLLEHAPTEQDVQAVYAALLRNHRWWRTARDPAATGLVTTLHPWETGMDNSPAWDAALARVPATTKTAIQRRDTSHIDASMRPRGEEYQRFIHLVETFGDVGWQPHRMLEVSPFRVADVGTNAILLRAEQDLLALAERFGTPADQDEITARIAVSKAAIGSLWNPARNLFSSRDLVTGQLIDIGTSAGFLPLWADAATATQVAALAETLCNWAGKVGYLVPSTDPSDPAFEPVRYWRGPVWSVVNWMITDGLARNGQAALAERVRDDTRRLVEASGLFEYFSPVDGRGAGGAAFSWTAAVDLMFA